MDELVEFLLERIAEDEKRIYRSDGDAEYRVAWLTYRQPDGGLHYTALASDHRDDNWVVTMSADRRPADVSVILDARRALADCEARRQLVQTAEAYMPDPDLEHDNAQWAFDVVLRHLAAVYADDPGYRQEWRP